MNHQGGIRTTGTAADNATPQGNSFGITSGNTYVDNSIPTGKFMHASTMVIQNTGGNQSQNNMQPFRTMRYSHRASWYLSISQLIIRTNISLK